MIGAKYTAPWGLYRVHREDGDELVLRDVASPSAFVPVSREKLAREYTLTAAAPEVADRDVKPSNVPLARGGEGMVEDDRATTPSSSAEKGAATPGQAATLAAGNVAVPPLDPGNVPASSASASEHLSWRPPPAKRDSPETLGAPIPASSYHVPRASHTTGLYWIPCIRRHEGESHAWFVSAGGEVLCPACRSSERATAPAWSELPPPPDPATKTSLERVAAELRAMFRPGQWGRVASGVASRPVVQLAEHGGGIPEVGGSSPPGSSATPLFAEADDLEQLDQVVEDLAPFPPEPTCDDCGRRMRVLAVHENGLRFCYACLALSDLLRERIARRAAETAPAPPNRWRQRDDDSHPGNARSEVGSFRRTLPPPDEERPAAARRATTRELWPAYTSEVER